MRIDLKQLFEVDGESLDLSAELLPSDAQLWEGHPFTGPIVLRGRVCNTAGVVELSYTASFTLETVCDRCLEPIKRPMAFSFSHLLAMRLENGDSDDYITVENGVLDFTELAVTDISLELPTKILCREDCKGLCPHCGQNLNVKNCNCSVREIDPRLAALKDLLS